MTPTAGGKILLQFVEHLPVIRQLWHDVIDSPIAHNNSELSVSIIEDGAELEYYTLFDRGQVNG